MKTFIFIAALLAIASCQDNADTPYILIGNWHLNTTNVTSSSDCCMPAGTLTITNTGSDTITLTATSWAGSLCGSRNSSYSQVIDGIDGSDSWNQLTTASGEPGIFLNDASDDVTIAVVAFVDGQDALDIMINENLACNSLFIKSTNSTTPVIPIPIPSPSPADPADTADTPNILIGNWHLNTTNVTSSSDCCMPAGTLTITNTGSDTITLTATSWAGSLCGSRNSSYSQVIDGIDGSDSWNELTSASEEPSIYLSDASGDIAIAVMAFVDGQDALDIMVNENLACNSIFVKSTHLTTSVN